jgi:hypothetical protein
LKLHQLKYWLKRFETTNETNAPLTNWVSITMNEPSQELNETLHIHSGQASIEVKPGFNPSFLAGIPLVYIRDFLGHASVKNSRDKN